MKVELGKENLFGTTLNFVILLNLEIAFSRFPSDKIKSYWAFANFDWASASVVGVTVPACSFNSVASTFSLNLSKLFFLKLTTDWFE